MRFFLSSFLFLCSCSFLFPALLPEQCDASPPSCDGNTLLVCTAGFLSKQDCGEGVCNASGEVCELCGDGTLSVSEQCDDGNTQDGDGCDQFCLFEAGAFVTVPPQVVSENDALQCTTEFSNSGRKVAIDQGNTIYVAMFCNGIPSIASSQDLGVNYNSPVTLISADKVILEMAVQGGPENIAYAALLSETGELFFSRTNNRGENWSEPILLDSNLTTVRAGVSIASIDNSVYIAVKKTGGDAGKIHVWREDSQGVGTFLLTIVDIPNEFSDVLVDETTKDVLVATDVPQFHIAKSTDGAASFAPSFQLPGPVTSQDSDWAIGNGFVFGIGSTSKRVHIFPLDDLLSDGISIPGLPDINARKRAVTADEAGNIYVVSETQKNIQLDTVLFAQTSLDDSFLIDLRAESSAIAALPGRRIVVLAYTKENKVFATVRVLSEIRNCGNGRLEANEECDDGNNLDNDGCNASCLFELSCGNGTLEANEECDDGNNLDNDGCSNVCQLEADLFVLCDNADILAVNGSLSAPFRSVTDAIEVAQANQTIMILPQSPFVCQEASLSIEKSLTLQGLATPDVGNPPSLEGISAEKTFLDVDGQVRVFIKGLKLFTNVAANTVSVSNGATVAFVRTELRNGNANGEAESVLSCFSTQTLATNRVLIDQSIIHDSPNGGILFGEKCQGVVANSLLRNLGNPGASGQGAIRLSSGNSKVAVLASTFDNNINNTTLDPSRPSLIECAPGSLMKLDSSISHESNSNPIIGDNCNQSNITFSNLFGSLLIGSDLGNGNINEDPLFETVNKEFFHLSNQSPCLGTANSNQIQLPFDPLSTVDIDVFSHDFSGNFRSDGQSDMGMFEELQ